MEYGPQGFAERKVASVDELPSGVEEGKVYWIEMNGLGDVEALKALGARYDLHPLALEDTLNTGQRAKVEEYERHLFIVAQMIYQDETTRLCGEQVSLFLCRSMLITIQEEPAVDVFEPVRQRLRAGSGQIRKAGPDYLAYALLDSIIDHSFPVLEAVGDAIEALEGEILERPTKESAQKLHNLKRVTAQLRRLIWPERDVVNALLHDESQMISDRTKVFLRDCYDHTVQLMDFVESYRELVSGLADIYFSSISIRTNETMRVLTVISSIFIPLTFIAGVYGMNFAHEVPDPSAPGGVRTLPLNMPELYEPWGYVACLALMALIAIGMIIFFRYKKWL